MHDESIALIPLRARDGAVRAYAIVDAVDAKWVNQWRWHLESKGYARRNGRPEDGEDAIRLHRALLGLVKGDGWEGDHKDRDRLNCRRNNLRKISKPGNQQNITPTTNRTSGHRNVSWDRLCQRWRVQISVGGKSKYIGSYRTEQAAANAAQAARAKYMPFSTD